MPVFNQASTVGAAIDSVLQQTHGYLELIIVDDASSDDLGTVLGEINDPRLRSTAHQRNLGAATARNSGVAEAKGDYIAFIDSDDEWLRSKLEEQLRFMSRAPEEKLVSTTGFRLHRRGGMTRLRGLDQERHDLADLAMGCRLSPGSTLMTTRRHFEIVGPFDTDLERLEDWDWLIRSARLTPVWNLREHLAEIHVDGFPTVNAVQSSVEKLREKHLFQFSGEDRNLKRRFQLALATEIVVAHYRRGNFFKAAQKLAASCMVQPALAGKLLARFLRLQ